MKYKTASVIFEPALPNTVAKSLIACIIVTFSTLAQAEPALMQPIEDIQFQELPPPWLAQAAAELPKAAAPQLEKKKDNPVKKNVQVKPSIQQPVREKVVKTSPESYKNSAVLVKKPVPQKRSRAKTVQVLEAEALQGNAQSAYELGIKYQYGNGVQASRSKAHKWLNKSAEAGLPRAQYALGLFYQQYARNTQGIKKSLLWLKRAADQGLADAQYTLGMMFKNGNLVYQNEQEARRWLQMAAKQGHTAAQYALR